MPWGDVLFDFEQLFLHLINPILSIVLVFFFLNNAEQNKDRRLIRVSKMLSYPMIYYAFLWIFYIAISGKAAVYPFSNFYHPFLYQGNIFVIIIINTLLFIIFTSAIIGIYCLLEWLTTKRFKKPKWLQNAKWLKKAK